MPTTTDLDLADAIIALHGRVRRTLLAVKTDEVTASQSAVLGRLVRDGAQSTADLARAEGVRPQSMGATVQALVEMGLAERHQDPDDGRRAVLEATDAGRRARSGSRTSGARLIAERLSALPGDDRATIERALALLDSVIEA